MMAAVVDVDALARNQLVELPVINMNIAEFVWSSPFTRGSDLWKITPKHLQHHALPDTVSPDTLSFRDGLTGKISHALQSARVPLDVGGRKRVLAEATGSRDRAVVLWLTWLYTGATLSYGRLHSDALKVAASLVDGPLGLRPAPITCSDPAVNRGAVVSPIVLAYLPNSLQFPVLAFGTLAAGLTFTAINPVLTPGEVAHILSLSKPSVIVTTPTGLPVFQKAFETLDPTLQSQLAYPTKGNVFIVDPDQGDYGTSPSTLNQSTSYTSGGWRVQNWKVLLPQNSAPFSPPKYAGSEASLRAAVIFWSSGTSGKSKGVILSHKAVASALVSVWHYSTLGPKESLVGLPPFYHIFGAPWSRTQRSDCS